MDSVTSIKYKVYLTGRDYINWATDDDYWLTSKALGTFCDLVSIDEAEIIHSVNWHTLLQYNSEMLNNKYVIAHIPHDVQNMLVQKELCQIAPFVNKFVVPSKRAENVLLDAGFAGEFVPYPIDTERFYPVAKDDSRIKEIRKKYNIPESKYLIGSFQRDTEGEDLKTPKYMKGPDLLFNIVNKLFCMGRNMHVILAGPRRFWIREQLDSAGIPYTFVGENIKGRDDIKENTHPHDLINLLYNLIDLYIVSSRIEGGPKSILEASATKCKIISTKVGHSEDIMCPDAIYDSVDSGYSIVLKDIENGFLNNTVEANYQKALEHSITDISKRWDKVYSNIVYRSKPMFKIRFKRKTKKTTSLFLSKLFPRDTITILHTFHKPPWGGGNQFLIALSASIESRGWKVNNKISRNTRLCIFNSFTFDINTFKSGNQNYKDTLMVHRVDGPTLLVRGRDKELDDEIFDINNRVADITVFQSFWSYQKTIGMGYKPVNPIIIYNAVNPLIFNRNGKVPFSTDRKIRLVSTSWSNNVRKGFEIYKWLDDNLDWNLFDYTFVGNIPHDLKFDNIKHIFPLSSEELAIQLKKHDIYITASKNDPCSNALLEALNCGLPAMYLNDGGHPEIVGYGGLGFDKNNEIPFQLDRLIKDYCLFQNLITIPTIDKVTDKYLSLLDLLNEI